MPPAARRRRDPEGQATVEVVGLTLAVAALLSALMALAGPISAAADVAHGVRRTFARAVCLAGLGTACRADQAACVQSSDGHTVEAGVTIIMVHIGGERTVLVRRMSDGSFVIDKVKGVDGGAEASATGATARGRVGSHHLSAGTSVTAALLAHAGATESWTVRSERDARAVVDALTTLPPRSPPIPPSSVAHEGGVSATVAASIGDAGASLDLAASGSVLAGVTLDRRSGARTIYLHPAVGARASLSMAGAGGSAGAAVDEVYAVTVDRSGRPTDLAVTQSAAAEASAALPAALRAALRAADRGVPGVKRTVTVERHLDLADADAQAAALAFLGGLLSPSAGRLAATLGAPREIARRIDASGTGVAQVHAVQDGGAEAGGQASVLGVSVGAEAGVLTTSSRLLGAVARGPDGHWYAREDCAVA